MLFQLNIPSSVNQSIQLPILNQKEVELWLKREDIIHPFVSGNKFRKLIYNIKEAKRQQKNTLLTFGGAFSNHIAATAIAGKIVGLSTIGIIRGDELRNNFEKTLADNSTLREAYSNGMQIKFVSREVYRDKTSKEFLHKLKEEFVDFFLIPEGGTNELAIQGCEKILTEEDGKFNYICCAVGTGGTISGLINSTEEHQKILGFPALKGDFLNKEILQLARKNSNWTLENNYHFGGYGKYNVELIRFINYFKEQTGVLLDPIYTGKMMFGIINKIENNHFPTGSKILAIHTGGLQGIGGINRRLSNKDQELIQV